MDYRRLELQWRLEEKNEKKGTIQGARTSIKTHDWIVDPSQTFFPAADAAFSHLFPPPLYIVHIQGSFLLVSVSMG